jgi:hypothetical protein
MRPPSLCDTFVISSEVLYRDLSGEAVILDLASGTYYGLNAVGAHIWQLIAHHGELRLVFEELCQEYDASPGDLERDLIELVGRLADACLVEVKIT